MITEIVNNLIWFMYNGDEICWDGSGYLSILSGGKFSSLEELDGFWEDYFNAVKELNYESIRGL